jgi:hypothetical protein
LVFSSGPPPIPASSNALDIYTKVAEHIVARESGSGGISASSQKLLRSLQQKLLGKLAINLNPASLQRPRRKWRVK